MKKVQIKVGDVFKFCGNLVIVTRVIKTRDDVTIYVADVDFDENDIPVPMLGTENWLTDSEIQKLKGE